MTNKSRADGHTWIQTIAGIIAILGFFGILIWTDLLPSLNSSSEFEHVINEANQEQSTISLGSGWTPSSIAPAGSDTYRTYSHYPSGNLTYENVYVDDDLSRVDLVCRNSIQDITSYFERRVDISNPQNLPHYRSVFIDTKGGQCHINFTVIDNFGGNMGIDIIDVTH